MEGVYPGGASCGCVLVILVACFPKQALVSADMADRVLETSETRATTASVNIGSSPSKSLGSLRLGTISFSWEAYSLGCGTSSVAGPGQHSAPTCRLRETLQALYVTSKPTSHNRPLCTRESQGRPQRQWELGAWRRGLGKGNERNRALRRTLRGGLSHRCYECFRTN